VRWMTRQALFTWPLEKGEVPALRAAVDDAEARAARGAARCEAAEARASAVGRCVGGCCLPPDVTERFLNPCLLT